MNNANRIKREKKDIIVFFSRMNEYDQEMKVDVREREIEKRDIGRSMEMGKA